MYLVILLIGSLSIAAAVQGYLTDVFSMLILGGVIAIIAILFLWRARYANFNGISSTVAGEKAGKDDGATDDNAGASK